MKNSEATRSAAQKMLEKLEDLDFDDIRAINLSIIMKGAEKCEMDEDDEETSDEERMKTIGKKKEKEEDG